MDVPAIRDNEVLVKVKRAAICGTDIHIYFWSAFAQQRLKLPMIFGHEFCGEVVEVGRTVKRVKKGDIVAAETHIPCEVCFQCNTGLMHVCKDMKIIGVHTTGAFSEYTALPEICAWRISPTLSPDVGAVYEPFGIGVHALTRHKVAGKRVLVAGAGPIGQFAVAVARLSGAMTIFATDVSDDRLAMATRMGADVVLNPRTGRTWSRRSCRRTDGFGIDIFVELSGNEQACQTGLKALRRGGAVSLGGALQRPGDARPRQRRHLQGGDRLTGSRAGPCSAAGPRPPTSWTRARSTSRRSSPTTTRWRSSTRPSRPPPRGRPEKSSLIIS
ncbi:MAG: alcohol dehydrogenase catalytic domain-containing protein [Desulfomicrobium escambiense]|nr:alcohol dehydrogenase catalytic domain-containing protein [Desulfomicrobium escambiense]